MVKAAVLQAISANTILASPLKVKDLVLGAKERGYGAVALTDVNVTFGLADFYLTAKKEGIKPLLGIQGRYLGSGDQAFDLIFLAKSQRGYQSLMRLSSCLNLASGDLKGENLPSLISLPKDLPDLTAIVPAGPTSELRYLYDMGQESVGQTFLTALTQQAKTSGWDLCLGLYPAESAAFYNQFVQKLAKEYSLKTVITEDVRYLNPEDQFSQKVLGAIKSKKVFTEDELRAIAKGRGSHYLRPASELFDACEQLGLKEAFLNTWEIAENADAQIPFAKPQLPVFPQTTGLSSDDYLTKWAVAGLKRLGLTSPAYQERLAKELMVIKQMGFSDYFLIVGDIVAYTKKQGYLMGPGRGSAAGSLVAYALGITQIDPLKYDLLFERFLNPARSTMPDIDLDFTAAGRQAAMAYVQEKYGQRLRFGQGSDLVARILAFTTMQAKSALERVGHAFGLTNLAIDQLKKAMGVANNLDEAFQQPEFRTIVSASWLNQLVYQTAKKLSGLPEDTGTHAPGVVISEEPLSSKIGLMTGQEAPLWTVQQTKEYVEKYGLLKIDFLTLSNLEMLEQVLKLIKERGTDLDLLKIPLNDPEVFRLLQAGKTALIFQLGSRGMQDTLRQLKPESFDDLSAAIALYRPGPIKSVPLYAARKNGQSPVSYLDDSLRPILAPTYGILVYQEQVIQTAQKFAGFNLSEADIFRQAISKKEAAVLEEQKAKFVKGALKQGHSQEKALEIFRAIEPFAGYGFNHSHAVAYALLAYWEAYLLVHYPQEFFLVQFGKSRGKDLGKYYGEAQKFGLQVFGPDINHSEANASVHNGAIYLGFRAVIGLTDSFIDNLLALKRPITSFSAFLRQLDDQNLKENQIKLLIAAGAFDQLDSNRNNLLANCLALIKNAKMTKKSLVLQDMLTVKLEQMPELTASEKMDMERQSLGFAITKSPLALAQRVLGASYQAVPFTAIALGQTANVLTIFERKNDWLIKKGANAGQKGSNAYFNDSQLSEKVTIFSDEYRRFKLEALPKGTLCLIRVSKRDDQKDPRGYQLILRELTVLSEKKLLEKAREVKQAQQPKPKERALEQYFDQHFQTVRLRQFHLWQRARAIVKVLAVRDHLDKNGNQMATLSIADSSGRYRALLFAEEFRSIKQKPQAGSYYLIDTEGLPSQNAGIDFKIYHVRQISLQK